MTFCVFYAKSAIGSFIFGIVASLPDKHYRSISIAGHEIGSDNVELFTSSEFVPVGGSS
jgi:hypothetical protein